MKKYAEAVSKLSKLESEKSIIHRAALYLAKHEELVHRDPLNTERLVYALMKAEMSENLRMVVEVLLDNRGSIIHTFSELKQIFELACEGKL
jgi:hypothetical protein